MKIFIYTLLLAVVVLGAWLGFKKDDDSGITPISIDGKIDGEYSLSEIIALDESYKCEFEREDDESSVEGEIFTAPGPKVRGDFEIKSTAVESPFQSHFIIKSGVIYTWTSLLNVGFKSLFVSTSTSVLNTDEKMKYECSQVPLDQTKFDLPSEIIFK